MMSFDPGVSIYKGFNVMLSLSDGEIENLAAVARRVRLRLLDIFSACGKGHYGGCYSVTDILVMLYGKVLRVDPARPCWADRDRLILSKGHTNAALCAVLGHHGFFDEAELATYAETDSRYGMHPDMHCVVGCDMSSGSLGHGLAVGIGMALAGRADGKGYRVYVVLSDGECNEGSVWEAAMVASHHKLDNMIAIVDRNRLSLDGPTEEILTLEPLAEKWRSFGWHVVAVDGHAEDVAVERALPLADRDPGARDQGRDRGAGDRVQAYVKEIRSTSSEGFSITIWTACPRRWPINAKRMYSLSL